MTALVLTIVGSDRSGLVEAVADAIDAHGGNWENSELAELAGVFAGVVQATVAADRVDELRATLEAIDGLTVAMQSGADVAVTDGDPFTLTVLGNDRPGIVREISRTLRSAGLSIERIETATRDAAMAGGRLFEASIVARVPASVDLSTVQEDLERLAGEIQVDVAFPA